MEALPAPPVDLPARELAGLWYNRLEGDRLTEPMPDKARSILLARFLIVDTSFRATMAGTLEPYLTPVAEMLHIYHKAVLGDKTIHSYAYVLAQQVPAPVWAVRGATDCVLRGEIAKPEFAPLPGLLRALAWRIARPFWIERTKIAKVIAAKEPRAAESLERRRAVAARIKAELRNHFSAQSLAQVSYSVAGESQPVCEVFGAKALDLDEF